MRLRFGPDDEAAASKAVDQLTERFAGWLDARPAERGAEPEDAALLLEWKCAYGDGDLGRWDRLDVDEVLLRHLPRKLGTSPIEAASIPHSLGALARFLDHEGLLDRSGDTADAIARRALAQERAFLDAMADPTNFGMGKRLLAHAGLDLDDDLDQATLDAAVAQFNALPFEDRDRILGLDDEAPPPLPLPALAPRDLPDLADLAPLAAEVPLVARLGRLHAALSTAGAKLTKAGNLTLADARRLVADVGLDDRVEGIRSSIELPGLFALVRVGLVADAVAIERDRLVPVAGWEHLSAVARWQATVESVLANGAASLQNGAHQFSPLQLIELADEGTIHFLAVLWSAEEAVVPAELAAALLGVASMEGSIEVDGILGEDFWIETCRRRIDDVLTSLAQVAIVEADEDGVRLTGAGARLVAPWLAEAGFPLVLPEDLASMNADAFLDLLLDGDVEPALAARWARARPGRRGADELLAALGADPSPARLSVGFAALEHLGTDAVAAVTDVLGGPLAPQAWAFLAAMGAVEPEEVPEELAMRAGVDLFLAIAELGTPAEVIDAMLEQVPVEEHVALVEGLAGTDHPQTDELLELIGRHHPDKALAKHARKLAHRWRTGHPHRRS
jgi:hypothetical protein